LKCDKALGSTSGALRTIRLLITGTYPIGRESDRLHDTTDDQPRQATLFTDVEPGSVRTIASRIAKDMTHGRIAERIQTDSRRGRFS